jgi:hypothetical protein
VIETEKDVPQVAHDCTDHPEGFLPEKKMGRKPFRPIFFRSKEEERARYLQSFWNPPREKSFLSCCAK